MSTADSELVADIRAALRTAADPAKAAPMRAYMKSEMPFLGVPKPDRVRALRPLLRQRVLGDPHCWEATVRELWDGAEHREERYAAIQLAQAPPYRTWARSADVLGLFEHMIVTGAWWDLVDDVAIHSVGPVLTAHRATVTPAVLAWSRDHDRWRRRAAVICQVGANEDVDVELLASCVLASVDDPDFFLRKAIGWALRQHSRTDPDWVRSFVARSGRRLSALSRREALRVVGPGT
ncbi:3-methyladenine DNA glycosylase AlkD [Haloactinopolyspora alba]|uniref:3-methyladenine DNA glycosylase AlkD n=1 Tax=Haloactinopolyspora alba TaxID=648780 RepID=A0A2P8E2P3_9ACTN|nr:DNA alkylation repair protein [Haloactinopolyspora alba]PSL03745.1 3-methyladenine DNA glycosylase AlkD [Haloactinopolyspora alba]